MTEGVKPYPPSPAYNSDFVQDRVQNALNDLVADDQIFGWNATGADAIVRPSAKTIAAVRTSKPESAAMLAA